MNAAQHQFFNLLVQGAYESSAQLHEVAWTVLGMLLLSGILLLGAVAMWIFSGGFSRYFCLGSTEGRRVLDDWLHEP